MVLALLIALVSGIWAARGAMQVAVGYSAKQLYSGVVVAGLPEDFVRDQDILPRMAILGPLLGFLAMQVTCGDGLVSASLPGVSAGAVHIAGQYVVVIPEWETVVVRLGLSDPGVDIGMHEFLKKLAAKRAQAT